MSVQVASSIDYREQVEHGLTVEFTRDSPVFRQQLSVFEQTTASFSHYCLAVIGATQQVSKCLGDLKTAQVALSSVIRGGQDRDQVRSLFTSALPNLGNLTDTIYSIGDLLNVSNQNLEEQKKCFDSKILPIYEFLSKIDLKEELQMQREMEQGYSKYESLLQKAIQSTKSLDIEEINKLIDARTGYELQRFDLTAQLNKLENLKKLKLSEAAGCIFDSYSTANCKLYNFINLAKEKPNAMGSKDGSSKEVTLTVCPKERFSHLFLEIDEAHLIIAAHQTMWDQLRHRIESELRGYLPPPGAPPGAESPIQPRNTTRSCPLYTMIMTTEVLSSGTKAATFEDTRHARDDGVFKQGFLWTSSLLKTSRRWFRLFATKLYSLEVTNNNHTCTSTLICDILGATISLIDPSNARSNTSKNSNNKFSILTTDGKTYKFQAENEDEMIKWICSLRRCSYGRMGRPKTAKPVVTLVNSSSSSSLDSSSSLSTTTTSTSVADVAILVPPMELSIRDQPVADKVRKFCERNSRCGECSSRDIAWISTNIGITLCEVCASIHRQLNYSVSKVKSIELDIFYDYEIDLLIDHLGNDIGVRIWEESINRGWSKPVETSPLEEKYRWIIAKYYWFAFVDDVHTNMKELGERLLESISTGNVLELYKCISHRTDVNIVIDVSKMVSNPSKSSVPVPEIIQTYRLKLQQSGSSKSATLGGWGGGGGGKTSRSSGDGGGGGGGFTTALHEAVLGSSPSVICFLLQNGADVFVKDSGGVSPLELAEAKLSFDKNDDNKLIVNMIKNVEYGQY